MRRLRLASLPIVVGLLGVLGARRILRSIGEPLVPLLRHPSFDHAASLLLGVAVGVGLLLLARWIWQRTLRDRPARTLLVITCVLALGVSYVSSGDVTTRGDFHGLLTPEPNSAFAAGGASGEPVRHEINAHGFRAPAWTIEKAAGSLRVGIIGGSWAFGLGVDQEQILSAALARALAERFPGRPIEVLNLGISGNRIASDLRVARLAQTLLDTDANVLLLLLPGDLSRRDAQSERRAPLHVDAFSVVMWALGMQTASFLWDLDQDDGRIGEGRLALLREELEALRGFQREHGERPLLVLTDPPPPEPVRAAFSALPAVTLVELPTRGGDAPRAGAANQSLAEAIAAALPDAMLRTPRAK